MKKTEIESFLINLVRYKVYIGLQESVSLNSTIKELELDSLDYAEILAELEDEYGIFISEDELEDIKTLSDFVKVVEEVYNRDYGVL